MKYEIRELGIGGILDQSIKLIKDNFGLLFGIVLALLIPFGLVQGLITISVMPAVPKELTVESVAAYQRALASAQIYTLPLLLILVYFVIPVTNAALIHAISRLYLQQPTTVAQSYKIAFQRLVPLVWTWFLMGLAIMGGLLLLIIPGILAALWFALSSQVVLLEQKSGFGALGRSKALMKNNLNKLFCLGLVVGLINLAAGVAANFIPQQHLQVIAAAVVQGGTTMFASATAVIFYFSARCQHENFDLTVLAESVAATEGAPATAVEPA